MVLSQQGKGVKKEPKHEGVKFDDNTLGGPNQNTKDDERETRGTKKHHLKGTRGGGSKREKETPKKSSQKRRRKQGSCNHYRDHNY